MTFNAYFCGNKISQYGRENHRVDYATLAKAFDAVLCNGIMSKADDFELVHGMKDNSDEIDAIEDAISDLEDIRDRMEQALEDFNSALEDFEYTKDDICENSEADCSMFDTYDYEQDSTGEAYEQATRIIDELTEEKERLEREQDEQETAEVFQWYIISDSGADILKEYTSELVWYSEDLELYVWGVTHFGASWDYVLTEIACTGEEPKQEDPHTVRLFSFENLDEDFGAFGYVFDALTPCKYYTAQGDENPPFMAN